jgi:thioredoxin 1
MSVKLNTEELDRLLKEQKEAGANKLLVADFYADWCMPCKVVAPKVEALAEQYKQVKFVKIDLDKAQGHREAKDVSAIPTFKIYKNGEKQVVFTGTDMSHLERQIKSRL